MLIAKYMKDNSLRDKKLFSVRLADSLDGLWHRSEGISLKNIRPEKAVYMMAYSFELMLYAVWQTFLPVDTSFMGLPGSVVIYVGHILMSLAIMMLWSDRFRRLLLISVAVLMAGTVPFLFLSEGPLRLLFGFIAMAGLGGAVTCARCGFAFACNNSERMVGIILMTVTVAGIYLLDAFRVSGAFVSIVLPLLLLAALVSCLLRFREGELEAKEESSREDAKGLYCALAFMIVYFGIDGYLYKLIDRSFQGGYILFCVGMVIAAVLFYIVLGALRLNAWHLWSLFFILVTVASLLAALAPQVGSRLPHHLFAGLSILGWPLSLYMLACAQRRFASYRLLKMSTLIFVILSPLTTISDDVLCTRWPEKAAQFTLIYVLAALALFLLTLPYTYKHMFAEGWFSELHQYDMDQLQEMVEETDRFGQYGLTPREKEIAALLLAAKTRRQIAGELGLTESTVKTHVSNLYKKLQINSRIELMRRFSEGPADGDLSEAKDMPEK